MNIPNDVKNGEVFIGKLPISWEDVEDELAVLIGWGSIHTYLSGMTKGYNKEATIMGLSYWHDKGVRMGITLRKNPTIYKKLWKAEINKLSYIAEREDN